MNEQIIPEAARRDPNAVEMLRVWVAEKGLHCSIQIGMYEDNGIDETRAWGILLADVIRHVSRALEVGYEKSADVSERQIIQNLLNELGMPTSEISGKFPDT